jgi:hypothetical protein
MADGRLLATSATLLRPQLKIAIKRRNDLVSSDPFVIHEDAISTCRRATARRRTSPRHRRHRPVVVSATATPAIIYGDCNKTEAAAADRT